MTTIPCTCDIHQLRDAYEEACARPPLNHDIVVNMHHCHFREYLLNPGGLALQRFRQDIVWVKSRLNIGLTKLSQFSANISLGKSRIIYARHLRNNRTHWHIQRWLPKHLLLTSPLWCYLRPTSTQQ